MDSPLPAVDAQILEIRQITDTVQLPALVSLTDHDSIAAGLNLHVMDAQPVAPISVEWTALSGWTVSPNSATAERRGIPFQVVCAGLLDPASGRLQLPRGPASFAVERDLVL